MDLTPAAGPHGGLDHVRAEAGAGREGHELPEGLYHSGSSHAGRRPESQAVLAWVHRFNTQRLLEPIGYVPPAEYEEHYYEQQAKVA